MPSKDQETNEARTWISVIPDIPSSHWVKFDVERSEINFSALGSTEPLKDKGAWIWFFCKSASSNNIRKLNLIPGASGGSLLVSGKVLDMFQALDTDDFEVLDTTIRCRDGIVTEFKAIHPLRAVACTDFSRSKVDWLLEGFLFADCEEWCFLDNALGGACIAREKHTRKTVVSDELKEAISGLAPKESLFVQPMDYPF